MNLASRLVVGSVGVVVVAGMTIVGGAGTAAAMGTFQCDLKGTANNETIIVEVPAGHTTPATPWVVCPGNGIDTIIINQVMTGGPAYLYLAMGNGQKTVRWNAGNVTWGAAYAGYPGGGIITRPEASPNIIMTGTNSLPIGQGSTFDCGTNVQYKQVANQKALDTLTGHRLLYWRQNGTQNVGNC